MRWAARAGLALIAAAAAPAAVAQQCPPVDVELQNKQRQECAAAGGAWSRYGVRDHLCGVYSCAPRTADGGKPCRDRVDCEYLCVSPKTDRIGAEVTGECARVRTSFGCFTHVDQGKVVGRVCVD